MAPRSVSDLDQFLTYFPDEDPARVRQGLTRALQTTERELPVLLAELGDELVFHVATNPELRARIVKPTGPKKRGRPLATRSLGTASVGRASAGIAAGAPDRFSREASAALPRLMR